jgi:O-antigen/teichoic acid export membrane protein
MVSTVALDSGISPESAATPSPGDLASKAKSGVLWITGLNLFRDVLQFGTMLVLVRLLAPKAYGEFSLITSVMGFFTVCSFRSFVEQTMQLRPNEPVDYQNHFTFGGLIQAVMFGAVNLAAVILRHFPKYAEVAPVFHLTSIFFLLDWPSELRLKMLERELNWKRLRTLQAVGVAGNALLAILLAMLGLGVYALVLPGMMMLLPLIWDLFVSAKWRPDWTFRPGRYKAAWAYGWTRIMAGILTSSRSVLEGAVVVQFAGFSQLGIMGRAVGLASLCCLKIPAFLTSSLYPVLTRLSRTSEAFGRGNAILLRLISWMVIPAAVLFSMTAPPLIRLVYGSKWDAAVPLLPWALAAGTAASLYMVSTMLMLANVQHRRCAVGELFTLISVVLCLYFVLPLSIASYLCSVAIVQWCVLMWMLWSLKTTGALSTEALIRGLAVPLGASAAGWAACSLCSMIGILPQSSRLAYLGAVAPLFLLLYGLCIRTTCPRELRELINYSPLPEKLKDLFVSAVRLA